MPTGLPTRRRVRSHDPDPDEDFAIYAVAGTCVLLLGVLLLGVLLIVMATDGGWPAVDMSVLGAIP